MADEKRTDKEREAKLQEQQEAFARANAGLPPKNAPTPPGPEALPITDRQAEKATTEERKTADRQAAQETRTAQREAPAQGARKK